MTEKGSVSAWLEALKSRDEEAASQLWKRYFGKLAVLARRQLDGTPRRVADEEDVALSVFRCVCQGAAESKFSQLENRDDLWQILTVITVRKVIDQQRRQGLEKRGGGRVWGESELDASGESPAGLDQFWQYEPTPDLVIELTEEYDRLLKGLGNETLQQIVLWKAEGLTSRQISSQLGTTVRSVERKLQRIRERWQKELEPW